MANSRRLSREEALTLLKEGPVVPAAWGRAGSSHGGKLYPGSHYRLALLRTDSTLANGWNSSNPSTVADLKRAVVSDPSNWLDALSSLGLAVIERYTPSHGQEPARTTWSICWDPLLPKEMFGVGVGGRRRRVRASS